MLLSNFTFNLSISHSELFQVWLKQEIEQSINKNPLVVEIKTFRLLTEVHGDGHTFSVQFFFHNYEDFLAFELNFRDQFLGNADRRFAGNYAFFHTLLQTL